MVHQALSAQLVQINSNWKYYDLAMEPPNQSGTTWKQNAYNDGAWSSGLAELGYGDGDETTVISSATETAYFRQTFYVDDPADFSDLSLHLLYDDGAVVYLNGAEVWRVNMPSGNIVYNTTASGNSGDNATANTTVANALLTGNNVIAIEVHQHTTSSSDISFDFSLSGNPAAGIAVVTRGPYLQRATNNSMVVRWRTNIATASILDYGPATNSLTNTVSDNLPKTEHFLTIPNLTAATKYFYQIRISTDTLVFPSSNVYFKTYPVPGTETPVIAWILGDCGTSDNKARSVRNAYYNYIGSQHTDMMLFLGDNAYVDGTDAQYQTALFQNMYEAKLKNSVAWSCLGNHDGHSADSPTQTGPYYDIFTFPTLGQCGGEPSGTEAYYSYDFGNIHFIILDSYDTNRDVTGAMHQWCQMDLEETTADWIIAFWHHPAYSKGSHDSDTESNLVQMRENFLPLFENFGVDLVLSGHSHSYERSYLVNGHYGLANTFNINTHTVGIHGDGSGQLANDGAYYKAPAGPEGGDGMVYITTGSAGKTEAAPLDHPVMFYDAASLGSCVLKINQDTLSVIYLRQSGAIDDQFVLIKDRDCVPGNACNDQDPCTINDVYDNNCFCRGVENLRLVTNNLNIGSGSLRDAVTTACDGDTIRFTNTVTDTIRLSSEILINKNLVIDAMPADDIIVSGQLTTRLFNVQSGKQFSLSNITLHGGNHPTQGGAIFNAGQVILDNTVFVRNMQGTIPRSWTSTGEMRVRQGTTFLRLN